ncbi:MAG: TetR/AcrR family transcriptional regulator [Thermoanaerobaculia bacterium]|nr:TetR/AcrR family transcriptional regulator [Thermoanaerobaculia bacterium]
MNEHSFMDRAGAILDSALELFGERSYGQTPVPLVAERAGVAAGTIYRYFPGKQGLVNAVYRRWKQALAEAVLDGLDGEGDPETAFREAWARLCAFVVAHPKAFAFLETHHHAPYLDAESRQASLRLDTAIAEVVAGWQRRGAVRTGDPPTLVAQVYGGLVGVARLRLQLSPAIGPDLYDDTVDAAWSLLARTPAETRRDLS